MKKRIFPKEIIVFSSESHFKKHSTTAKYIYTLSMLLILSCIMSLPFISLEISTQARGIIKSVDPSVNLISPGSGRITGCKLQENRYVKQGDTLIWIDQEKIEEKTKLIRDISQKNRLYVADINSLLKKDFNKVITEAYIQKLKHFKERLSELELEISVLKKEYDRNQKLYESEVIPIAEIDQIAYKYQNAIKTKEIFVQTQKRDWILEKKQLEESDRELLAELNQLEEDRNFYYLVSPIDGVISEYKGQKEGSYVAVNQEIATITPVNNLIIDTYVNPSDISFIRKGMEARFQFDSYNYNQWGMGSGKVIDIANQPIVQNDQLLFKVRCSLNETHLQLKSGYKGVLKNGITLTSRFEITERTILQLLYDKADKWLNPKLIVNNSEK